MDQEITEREDLPTQELPAVEAEALEDAAVVVALAAEAADQVGMAPAPAPAPAAHPRLSGDVEIRPGVSIPAELVRQHFDPRCTVCRDGIMTVVLDDKQGKRAQVLCGCAIRRCQAKIAHTQRLMEARERAAAAPAPAAGPLTAKVHERLGKLGQRIQAVKDELAGRARALEAEIAPLEEEVRADRARLQDTSTDELRAVDLAGRLTDSVAELEGILAETRERLDHAQASVIEARHMKATLEGEISRVEAAIEERRRRLAVGTSKLQKELAKLQRRASGVRIYNPEAVALPPPDPAPAVAT